MTSTYRDAVARLTAPGAAFEIVETTINGIDLRTYRHSDRNLVELFDRGTARDAVALVYQNERFTFAELRASTLTLASASAAFGIKKGDRVAIAMRNLPEYVFAFWATQRLGAVLVGLNAWWVGSELAFALEDSKPKLLLADGERYDRLAPDVCNALPAIVVTRSTAALAGANVKRWDEFLDLGIGAAPAPHIQPDDPSTMLYTSGTTGRPKGAISTHRNHASNLMSTKFFGAVARTMAGTPLNAVANVPQPAALMPFPMFHIGGISSLYINMEFGAKLVLLRKWDAEEAAALIGRERITSIALAPSMLRQLIDTPLFDTIERSGLTGFAVGSAPVSADLARDARVRFGAGATPTVGYGLTETTSGVCANTGLALEQKPGSVGPPFPVTDVRIVDPDTGTDVAAGADGEIWLRGPNVVDGYWQRPDATAETFVAGGWFRSGDIGHLDGDGFLFIVDRLKDVIIRGGENIYCVEVENALSAHPAVHEVAVIGAPEPVLGEAVVAIVVPTPGMTVHADELIDFARQHLAYFKVPSRVVLRRRELERTPAGKVDKKVLRAELPAEHASRAKFKIFRQTDAQALEDTSILTMAPMSAVVADGLQAMVASGAGGGQSSSVLFCVPGFSLVKAWFKSGFPLPLHSHDSDCLYYVTAGSLRLGRETLVAGEGFFVAADVPYTYVPGPGGVEILEFRSTTGFDIKFKSNNPDYWAKVNAAVIAQRDRWPEEAHPHAGMIAAD